ncbi:hypothetical protein D1872_299200 [compost metagenome]
MPGQIAQQKSRCRKNEPFPEHRSHDISFGLAQKTQQPRILGTLTRGGHEGQQDRHGSQQRAQQGHDFDQFGTSVHQVHHIGHRLARVHHLDPGFALKRIP